MIKFLIILFLTMVFNTIICFSHPPQNIEISYNFDSQPQQINIIISHNVNDPNSHYIKRLTINQNGKTIITQTMNLQSYKNEEILIYKIPGLKQNDTLEIIAECNRYGNLNKKFVITSKELNFPKIQNK